MAKVEKTQQKRAVLFEKTVPCKDPYSLGEIQLYKLAGQNNYVTQDVRVIDDESFMLYTQRTKLVFKDEELKPNSEGKYIINIEALDLKYYYPNVDLPTEFEMPVEVLEERKEKRRLKALAKDAIHISHDRGTPMYFYIEGDKLRILQGEKEVIADKIEMIYGKKAVNAEALELGHPYMELPPAVSYRFERVLKEKELKSLKLIEAGKSLLDGNKYYGFNVSVPEDQWKQIKSFFTWFEGEKPFNGWLTAEPGKVAETLNIPIIYEE